MEHITCTRNRRSRRRTAEPQVAKVDTFDQCQIIGTCVGQPLQGGARPFHATYSCRHAHCTTRLSE